MSIKLLPHLLVFKINGSRARVLLFTQDKGLASELADFGFSPWFEPGFWQGFDELSWTSKLKHFQFSFMGITNSDLSESDFEEQFHCVADVINLTDYLTDVQVPGPTVPKPVPACLPTPTEVSPELVKLLGSMSPEQLEKMLITC